MTPVPVFFRDLELLSFSMPEIQVRIVCSKGTYIRSFARDLGLALSSGAYLSSLRRTAIGNNRIEDAYTLESFENLVKEMKPF
jgi:tRNA pseudouridine55 synthase